MVQSRVFGPCEIARADRRVPFGAKKLEIMNIFMSKGHRRSGSASAGSGCGSGSGKIIRILPDLDLNPALVFRAEPDLDFF